MSAAEEMTVQLYFKFSSLMRIADASSYCISIVLLWDSCIQANLTRNENRSKLIQNQLK